MRYVILAKPRKRGDGASSRSTSQQEAQADPTHNAADVPLWGRFIITWGPKRPRMEEPQDPSSVKGSSQRLDKRKGVEVAVHREVPPVPERPLVMPG